MDIQFHVMTTQFLIYLGMLTALMVAMIVIGRQQRKLESLEQLIATSPAICFICYGFKHKVVEEDSDPLFGPHEYIDSRLVYIPDKLLR